MRLYDAHNHLQDDRFDGRQDELIADCAAVGLTRMVVNGTCEGDWPSVAALAKRHVDAANALKKWESLPGIVRMKHDGQMTFEVLGIAGTQCDIEASLDLKQWNKVGRVKFEDGRGSFRDVRRILLPRCFYRVKAVE